MLRKSMTLVEVIALTLLLGCSGTTNPGPATGGSAGAQATGGSSNAGGTKALGGGSAMTGGHTALGGSGSQCVAVQGSCTQGETCCSGLTCCAGVPVPVGSEYCGTNCPISDRNLKRGFASVNERDVLERLAKLPISTWSYKTESTQVQHLGPMAQDFKAAFGLGESDKTILQVDADGVAFAAIQALYARLVDLESSNHALLQRVQELESETQQCRVHSATGSHAR
jgi:hypothetical protein